MKKLKTILSILFLGLATSLTMTSCLDSDSNNGLSQEDINNCVKMMSGTYNTKMFFYTKGKTEIKNKFYNDSIENLRVQYSYTAQKITVMDAPVKQFFKQLEGHDELKKAVEDMTTDWQISYIPIAMQGQYVQFVVQPETISFTATYGGASHDIKIVFMANSQGVYANNVQDMLIYEAAVYEDSELINGKSLYEEAEGNQEKQRDIMFEIYGSNK